jgi:uncharacterized protein YdiU (UPF0061 family)
MTALVAFEETSVQRQRLTADKVSYVQTTAQKKDMYHDFYAEVVRRTLQLAAAWQCVGFCHGE